jgi:hypothetical protein
MDEDKNKTPVSNTPDANKDGGNGGKGDEKSTPKTFTQEEHQAELDRIAGKTRDEEKVKAEKLVAEAVNKALTEERRLAKLSQEEKEKELLEKSRVEIDAERKSINKDRNELSAVKKLTEYGMPVELSVYIVSDDSETTTSNLENLKKIWDKSLNEKIEAKLKGDTPKAPDNNNSNNQSGVITTF